jgi:formimidoylglutamate deiminase
MSISFQPDLIFVDGSFRSDHALNVSDDGIILSIEPVTPSSSATIHRMPGRALLPGMIDIHSHSFQRALRGKAESRRRSGPDFWSWRNIMYRCALALTPEEIYDVARLAFLEMLLAGITTVGEFHYLHRTAAGTAYDDPNLLAKQVIRAAESVGIRIALLRCAYVRAGFNLPPDPGQIRFIEPDADAFLLNSETLSNEIAAMPETVTFGIAPHSVRAVPRDYLKEISAWTQAQALPLHMHVSEQPAEVEACVAEYGVPPFHFLDQLGLLTPDFTAIHAIHLQSGEIERMASGRITVGACPTTERNLGDGILCADKLIDAGVSIALGTDSHTQTDALENARELESNLRLQYLQRAVLDGRQGEPLPSLLFDFATKSGAGSLHVETGSLQEGRPADFFTVDLSDCSIAGSLSTELLTNIVFSMSRSAICDVAVAGKIIIDQKRHGMQDEIITSFHRVQQRLGAEL